MILLILEELMILEIKGKKTYKDIKLICQKIKLYEIKILKKDNSISVTSQFYFISFTFFS